MGARRMFALGRAAMRPFMADHGATLGQQPGDRHGIGCGTCWDRPADGSLVEDLGKQGGEMLGFVVLTIRRRSVASDYGQGADNLLGRGSDIIASEINDLTCIHVPVSAGLCLSFVHACLILVIDLNTHVIVILDAVSKSRCDVAKAWLGIDTGATLP